MGQAGRANTPHQSSQLRKLRAATVFCQLLREAVGTSPPAHGPVWAAAIREVEPTGSCMPSPSAARPTAPAAPPPRKRRRLVECANGGEENTGQLQCTVSVCVICASHERR